MHRIIVGLAAVLASFTVLHSGKTDGNGGHYNRSTGEYHYHHGYPAHSHYDMNGDGIVDCPYSYKDNTSYQSSTSKSEIKTNSSSKSPSNKKVGSKIKTTIEALLVVCGIYILPWAIKSIFEVIRKYVNRK